MLTPSTKNQQMAQKALELFNQSAENSEMSLSIKAWFQQHGITPRPNEHLLIEWENRYTLTKEQFSQIAEVEIPDQPSWFPDPLDHPLLYAAPGLYVAFVLDNGKYIITMVTEVKMINRGTMTLLGLEGPGKGWYSIDGVRVTKEGQRYQGSAYAGKIVPVNDELLDLIERQELLALLTGYHQAPFRPGGTIHAASTQTLRMVRDLLERQERCEAIDAPASAEVSSAQQ
jgi:hypothetical protein